MTTLFTARHEAGDFSEYTTSAQDAGDCSIVTDAALAGTGYGMSCLIDDANQLYGSYTISSASTTGILRFRFYIYPNELSLSDLAQVGNFWAVNSTGTETFVITKIIFSGGQYNLRCTMIDDGGTHQETALFPITDSPHWIEVLARKATTSSSNDATLETWVDGAAQTTLTGVDCFTRFETKYIVFGAPSQSGTVSGTFYVDELIVKDDATVIGPLYGAQFIAVGAQVVTNTGGATLSPAIPTGTSTGDLMLMLIGGRCAGSTITNTFSNTWTLLGSQFLEIGAQDLWVGVYARYAVPGEAAPTVTPDSDFLPGGTTGGVSAQIATFRYVSDTEDVTEGTGTSTAQQTWTAPGLTTVTPNCLIVSCVVTADDNALNFNTSNGFKTCMSGANYDTTTGSDHAVGMAYYIKTSAGAVTMCVWNESAVGNDVWAGVTVALRPGIPLYYINPTITLQAVNRAANY